LKILYEHRLFAFGQLASTARNARDEMHDALVNTVYAQRSPSMAKDKRNQIIQDRSVVDIIITLTTP